MGEHCHFLNDSKNNHNNKAHLRQFSNLYVLLMDL